jgi:arylsulfatase A
MLSKTSMQRSIKLCLIVMVSIYSNATICAQSKNPNVIVFIADDFGYGSTNVYGASEELIKTPNVNKLAKEGVKFTNAYTTGSVCTPTRYALLTGQYSWRSRLKKGVVNMNDPALIDVERKTLPKYMQSLGYKTAMVGKWHLGFKEEKFCIAK